MIEIIALEKNVIDTLDLYLKIAGSIGALTIFFIGYSRYVKDQKWKRYEFIALEIKEFNNDFMAQNAMYMLDWKTRSIELFPKKIEYKERYFLVNRDILKKALIFHGDKKIEDHEEKFSVVEQTIRDTFDRYFSFFERFSQFIDAGLIKSEDINHYIKYWITKISPNDTDSANEKLFKEVLYNYICKYGFTGTQNIFKKNGVDMSIKEYSDELKEFISTNFNSST